MDELGIGIELDISGIGDELRAPAAADDGAQNRTPPPQAPARSRQQRP
jgi:hypothetical protein